MMSHDETKEMIEIERRKAFALEQISMYLSVINEKLSRVISDEDYNNYYIRVKNVL